MEVLQLVGLHTPVVVYCKAIGWSCLEEIQEKGYRELIIEFLDTCQEWDPKPNSIQISPLTECLLHMVAFYMMGEGRTMTLDDFNIIMGFKAPETMATPEQREAFVWRLMGYQEFES